MLAIDSGNAAKTKKAQRNLESARKAYTEIETKAPVVAGESPQQDRRITSINFRHRHRLRFRLALAAP